MRMRQAAWALALALLPTGAAPAVADDLNFTTHIDGDKAILSCSDIDMRFWKDRLGRDDIVTERRDQAVALRALDSAPLRVRGSDRGGIRVQPSTDGSYSALVCLAAGAASREVAVAILDRLHVDTGGGELSVRGPAGG